MISSENYNVSIGLPEHIEAAIIQMTEFCLQAHLCMRYLSLITKDLFTNLNDNQKPSDVNKFISGKHIEFDAEFDVYRNLVFKNNSDKVIRDAQSPDPAIPYNPQSAINEMTDFGVAVAISKFSSNGNGVVKIPTIYSNFSTGTSFWLTTGEFEAINGTFEDLRSLKRMADVVFLNKKLRFSVGSTYKLSKAKLTFGGYRVRYGKIKTDGKLVVDIDGITLRAKVSLDYNASPCKLHVDEFEIDELGDINVEFTGLGLLNSQASKIIEWIIRKKTFVTVKKTVTEQLQTIDCEKLRP